LPGTFASFDAAPPDLNGSGAFSMPGLPGLQDALRQAWLALQPTLPLVANAGSPHRRSYVAIASEAAFGDYPLATERPLVSLLNMQPFIWLGSPDTLRYLRALGFRTFGRVIDESYDKPDMFGSRMVRFFEQIQGLGARSDAALRDLYFECMPEMTHNRNHVIEGRHQLDRLIEELETKFGAA
jgi:hypothetical protein